jgi:hypothetical protein
MTDLDDLLRHYRDLRCEKYAAVTFLAASLDPEARWVLHFVCAPGHEFIPMPTEKALTLNDADEPIYVIIRK